MTKAELMDWWKGIPTSAKIFVEADHGQIPEAAYDVEITQEDDINEVDPEEIRWREIKPSTDVSRVTGIRIR